MCLNPAERMQLVIYYKSNTINNLAMRNNHSPLLPFLKQTYLIYEYTCKHGDCELHPSQYIGLTTTTLSRRLTMHLAGGAPKIHRQEAVDIELNREIIVNNTKKNIIKENYIRK